MEKDQLELLKKINSLRKEVKDKLQKSGENSYSHYSYFKLDDFLPTVVEHCAKEQDLFIYFEMKKDKLELPVSKTRTITEDKVVQETVSENYDYVECAFLTIVDLKTGAEKVLKKETREAKVQGASDIQNLGAKNTYMKRYMYMDLLELAEDDLVEENAGAPVKEESVKVTSAPKVAPTVSSTATKPVETSVASATQNATQSDELMSIADKTAITEYMTQHSIEPIAIVEIAKELGYASPVELRASDKDKVMEKINERVGKNNE